MNRISEIKKHEKNVSSLKFSCNDFLLKPQFPNDMPNVKIAIMLPKMFPSVTKNEFLYKNSCAFTFVVPQVILTVIAIMQITENTLT